MRILTSFFLLALAIGQAGQARPQPAMLMAKATADAQYASPETKRHAGRSGHQKQFCWNYAGLPISQYQTPQYNQISTAQIEALVPSYSTLENSFLPSEDVATSAQLDEMMKQLAEDALTADELKQIESAIQKWIDAENPPEEAIEEAELSFLDNKFHDSEINRPSIQYLRNRSEFEMNAPLMRGQLLAELARRKFNEEEYSLASDLAKQALAELEAADPAFVVAPYQITIDDTRGHREPEFAVSLAFLIRQLAEYALADSSGDPLRAYTVAHGLISEWLAVDSLYNHLISDNAYANTAWEEPHRFDPVGWATGSAMMSKLLSHFAANALIAHDPRSPEKHWKDLPGHTANAIFIYEGVLYADFRTNSSTETLSLRIAGAGDGAIPPVDGFGFAETPRPLNVGLIAGADLRDRYLRWLRAEVNRHSTTEVPFFAAIVEPGGYRLVLAPKLLQEAPEGFLGEYDTFFISEADTQGLADVADLTSGGQYLREVMNGLDDKMFTLYTAALHRVPGERQTAIDDMVFRLSAVFPSNVLRDIYTEETVPRAEAARTRTFGGPKDFVLLTASDDVDLQDFGIVNRLRESHIEPLKRQGMAEMIYNGQNASAIAEIIGGQDRRILIVTAHSDAELERMLHDLGRAGAFRNNTVFAYTCRTETSREMTEFIGGSGANGTWVFDRELLVDDATVLLDRTFRAIGDPKRIGKPMREIVPTLTEEYVPVFSISELTLPLVKQRTARAG